MLRRILFFAITLLWIGSTTWAQSLDDGTNLMKKKKATAGKTKAQTSAKSVAGGPTATAAEALVANRGKLFIKESSWDFGHVAQSSRVSHRFTLQNIGDDTLFIHKIKPT